MGALLGQSAALAGEAGAQRPDGELQKLPVDLLQRGKYQPRVDIRPESLQELADSIRAQGVVQPIVVRPLDEHDLQGQVSGRGGAARRYEIIAGERRWRAAQLAGLHEIPALIRRVPDQAAVAMALIENIQRENLNPLEEARALERLIGEFEMTHAGAAEAVGRSRAAVSNLLRLLELCEEVKQQIENRELEMGHARALLALEDHHQQAQIGAQVARRGLSVRETEALVKRLRARRSGETMPAAVRADANIRKLEENLSGKLGAKVSVQHSSSGKGRLIISYHTLDELDGILAHIR